MSSIFPNKLIQCPAPYSEIEAAQQSYLMQIFEITRDERENCLATWDHKSVKAPRSSQASVSIQIEKQQGSNKIIVRDLRIASYNLHFSRRIIDMIPDLPILFPHLTLLDFSLTSLNAIPPSFSLFHELTHIAISGNEIVQLPPDLFHNMLELQSLYLETPLLTTIPPLTHYLVHLTHFGLQDLPLLTEIPPFFKYTPNLEEIEFVNIGTVTLPSTVLQCSALTSIYIAACPNLTHFPELTLDPSKNEPHLVFPQLTYVDILECPSFQILPDYLIMSPHLEVLNCMRCPQLQFTPRQIRIAGQLVGANLVQNQSPDLNHYHPPKQPLDFQDD